MSKDFTLTAYGEKLTDCDSCGATPWESSRRLGPTVLRYSDTEVRVVCLICYHKGRSARTPDKAVNYWNSGVGSGRRGNKKLVAYRKKTGLSLEAFAELAGLSADTVRRVEIGQTTPTAKTRRKLEKFDVL